jgi:hypothetical protein
MTAMEYYIIFLCHSTFGYNYAIKSILLINEMLFESTADMTVKAHIFCSLI